MCIIYSGTSLIWTPIGLKCSYIGVLFSEMSSFQRLKEWYILGVGKSVLFREVSSVQECPCRGVPVYVQNEQFYSGLTLRSLKLEMAQ